MIDLMLPWQCLSIYILSIYPVFIMAMPVNMISYVCHTMYIVI